MKPAKATTPETAIEVAAKTETLPAKVEAPAAMMAVEKGSPLDLPPEQFKQGLDRRKQNRDALISWIRDSLKEGVDWARIHVVGRNKCPKGNQCKEPSHYSKPCLHKPGAEKICGMLGVTPTFPRLADYEQACLKGVELKQIILRCEMVSAGGQVVAVGVGARRTEQDYGDLNKGLKMCEKSGMIDATLRMAGLSEVFTLDMEDEYAGSQFQGGEALSAREEYLPRESESATPSGNKGAGQPTGQHNNKSNSPSSAEARTLPNTAGKGLPPATKESLMRFLIFLKAAPGQEAWKPVRDFMQKIGWLMPNEGPENLELRYVPVVGTEVKLFESALGDFMDGLDAKEPYAPHEASEMPQDAPDGVKTPSKTPKPQGAAKAPNGNGTWRTFAIHFGKKLRGKLLGDLHAESPDYFRQLCHEYAVETTWTNDQGQSKPRRKDSIEADRRFRAALDAAAQELGFEGVEA